MDLPGCFLYKELLQNELLNSDEKFHLKRNWKELLWKHGSLRSSQENRNENETGSQINLPLPRVLPAGLFLWSLLYHLQEIQQLSLAPDRHPHCWRDPGPGLPWGQHPRDALAQALTPPGIVTGQGECCSWGIGRNSEVKGDRAQSTPSLAISSSALWHMMRSILGHIPSRGGMLGISSVIAQ